MTGLSAKGAAKTVSYSQKENRFINRHSYKEKSIVILKKPEKNEENKNMPLTAAVSINNDESLAPKRGSKKTIRRSQKKNQFIKSQLSQRGFNGHS